MAQVTCAVSAAAPAILTIWYLLSCLCATSRLPSQAASSTGLDSCCWLRLIQTSAKSQTVATDLSVSCDVFKGILLESLQFDNAICGTWAGSSEGPPRANNCAVSDQKPYPVKFNFTLHRKALLKR
jgi:hypothetical protein